MFRLLGKGLIVGAAVIVVISSWTYYNTGRFWLPSFLVIGSKSVADAVSEIPITTSTEPATISSVGKPVEPTYKWQKDGRWHYGATPPKGAKAIKISE